ncbi:uncharacterized protein RCH25_008120 [Pelodytes ibericus]
MDSPDVLILCNTTDFSSMTNETERCVATFPSFMQALSIAVYSLTVVLGTVGNGLVIWVAGYRMKMTVNTIWFRNLGVADLIFDMFLALLITEWAIEGHWLFGQIACDLLYTVLFLNTSVSVCFLLIMSFDRCIVVLCPVWSKKHRTTKRATKCSRATWFACLTFNYPYFEFSENSDKYYCDAIYSRDYNIYKLKYEALFSFRLLTMFIIPLPLILCCYGSMMIRLRRSRGPSGPNPPLKVLISIVLCFFVFWLPFHLWPTLEFSAVDINWSLDVATFYLFHYVAFFKSCLNPMVYIFINHGFRKTVLDMETTAFPVEHNGSVIETPNPEDSINYFLNGKVFRSIQVITIISYSITFILGTVGNGLVIWIAGFKMKRMVTTIWFLNLGVADFVFNIFFPFQITEWTMNGHWPFGLILCKAIFFLLYLNMFVSISFLLIISADRCASVLFPVWSKNHRTPKLATIISAVTWTFSFFLSSPYLDFYNVVHNQDEGMAHCLPVFTSGDDSESWKRKVMLITQFVSMFLIPFSIILICYALIVIRIRRSRSLSGSNRPFKVIISIILCFFVCWFPFHFWPLLPYLNIEPSFTLDFVMFHIFCCLAFFNSCLNPILYVFIGRDFKKSLIKSIPFMLENTFKETLDIGGESQTDQTLTATELSTSIV